jgi:hypothetical protein
MRPVTPILLSLLVSIAAGCAVTQQYGVTPEARKASCAFLGDDVCAKLTENQTPGRFTGENSPQEALAGLRYINPSTAWTEYKQVLIPPVTFWADEKSSLSQDDQQKLIDFFHAALEKDLGAKLPVVQEPGPGVMSVQVALVDAESSTPVMRSISMALPQARVIGRLRYMATGSYGWVGGATAEVKIVDSVSGEVMAAGVDRRIGGSNVKNAAQWEWGDTEHAMDFWSQQIASRLSDWTKGIPSPAPPK